MKRCPDCKKEFGPDGFYTKASPYCKECQKARRKREYAALTPKQLEDRRRKRNNPHYKAGQKRRLRRWKSKFTTKQWQEMRRKALLKHRYGVTPEWYDAKLAEQDGCCAICKHKPNGEKLSVDHDHKCCSGRRSCGKCLRGLLCQPCNATLGYIETHVPGGLEKVIKFLNAQRSSNPGLSDQAPNGARWP